MALTIQAGPTPLRVDEQGVVRVGDAQVLLDIVIQEFNNGAEPEAIAHGYPTLDLADVYAVIAYYLRHRQEIDAYLQTRRQEAEKLRQEIEASQPSRVELRAKLLARKAQMHDAEDIFAETRPFMVDVEDVDDSREAIYTRSACE